MKIFASKKFKKFVRLLVFVVSLNSTPSIAEDWYELVTAADNVNATMNEIDSKVDTGFEVSNNQYGFGAKQKLGEDTALSFNVGARMNNSQDYNMSATRRSDDSRTNFIEEKFNPLDATPMVGLSMDYKF